MGYGCHLVRFGNMGHLGRFDAVEAIQFPRRSRVICRTARGLEVGEVLAPAAQDTRPADGSLVRRVTIQDELLLARIERRKNHAYRACAELLAERGLQAVLLDVEHLFDGQSLFFYFLGEISPDLDHLTAELAEVYEANVQFRKFTETLVNGCGPDCGTEGAQGGCGEGGCGSCALSARCASNGKG